MCDRVGVALVRGWVNFGVLAGWKGERYDTTVELKGKAGAKVGEMRVGLEIEIV